MAKKNEQPKALPTFDLINTYNEESAKQFELMQKHQDELNEAQALVNALNYRYENELRSSVVDGKDNEKELSEIADQLEEAERKLSQAKRKQNVASSLNKRSVTEQDILQGLSVYQSEYQKDVVEPLVKEVRKAKEAYINAFLAVENAVRHFQAQADAAYSTVKPNSPSGAPLSVGIGTQDNIVHKCITSDDLHYLARGQKPKSLAPRVKTVKNEKGHISYVPLEEDLEGGSAK